MLEVTELSYTYRGSDYPAISGLNFSVADGEIFGFLGPNGAGKSTTQKILIGLLTGFSGAVSVFGRDLRAWKSDFYERVGVSFEFPNLYLKLTALENLHYFRALYRGATVEPKELLEAVGLTEDADKRVSQFSKGMSVRLGFARALLNNPDLLFLDEPTMGLDPANALIVRDIIRQQKALGRTVFLTTHNMQVADELCDRVAFIVDGAIRLIDSPRDLKLRYGKRSVRVEYRNGDGTHSGEFPLEGLGDNAEFLRVLRERDIRTIHTQETTLEEVFLEVTGERLT